MHSSALYNFVMRIKINLKSLLLYAVYAAALICINRAAEGVPLSLGLCFAMLICGANIVAVPILYALSSIISLNVITCLLSLFEGGFLCAVTLIYRRAHKKIRAEAVAYLCIALIPFIAFSQWRGVKGLYFTYNVYLLKAFAAIAVITFTWFCFKSVYALLYRLYRCRLRAEELICLAAVFTVCGIGLNRLIGLFAYLSIACLPVILSVRLYRNASAVIIACVAALPCALCEGMINSVTAMLIISVISLLFVNAGRWAPSAACFASVCVWFYFYGAFGDGAALTVMRVLLLFCCCAAGALPTAERLERRLSLLTVKGVMDKTLEERIKLETGEKLFKTGEVFREIECAFLNLDQALDEGALRRRMAAELKERMCENCERKAKCAKSDVYTGFKRLIDSGCVKGKVNLVDLPQSVTVNCSRPADAIAELNRLLAEYRRLTLEAENAQNGRRLLADQAKGIAEVLKNCAVELSKSECDHTAAERAIEDELSARGISCPEIRVRGEKGDEILLTVVGKPNAAALRECLLKVTGKSFILKDKVIYDSEKSCLAFAAPPPYDAAFGVAYAVKDGEKASGDTHSVIKINEHCFLMALSDGMGSGEYANKVSSTAISLIEAFYRAEMPTDTVLDTINKLMCFNRDERFACIDVAAIDLNDLKAGFIKIGSPAGIIVRQGEIKVLESRSLPLGILDGIRPTVCEERLKCGDLVAFMSDGITSAYSSPDELYAFLETLKPLNPQNLAEKILQNAKQRSGGRADDDMTVLCVRIFERAEK